MFNLAVIVSPHSFNNILVLLLVVAKPRGYCLVPSIVNRFSIVWVKSFEEIRVYGQSVLIKKGKFSFMKVLGSTVNYRSLWLYLTLIIYFNQSEKFSNNYLVLYWKVVDLSFSEWRLLEQFAKKLGLSLLILVDLILTNEEAVNPSQWPCFLNFIWKLVVVLLNWQPDFWV